MVYLSNNRGKGSKSSEKSITSKRTSTNSSKNRKPKQSTKGNQKEKSSTKDVVPSEVGVLKSVTLKLPYAGVDDVSVFGNKRTDFKVGMRVVTRKADKRKIKDEEDGTKKGVISYIHPDLKWASVKLDGFGYIESFFLDEIEILTV